MREGMRLNLLNCLALFVLCLPLVAAAYAEPFPTSQCQKPVPTPTPASTATKHNDPAAIAAMFKALSDWPNDHATNAVRLINLLRGGINPDARDTSGRTPLMYAVAFDDEGIMVGLLIKNGADVNAQSRDEGTTALMEAFVQKRPFSALHLLAAGAKADIKDKRGRSAYDVAVEINDPLSLTLTGMLKPLTAAEIVAQDPPENASKNNKPEQIAVLFKMITARRDPARRGTDSTFLLSELLKMGVNPNARDRNGLTPLMHASAYDDTDAAEFLIISGADINAQSLKEGMTPLMGAAFKDKLMSTLALLRKGARKDLKDKKGRTAYDIAVEVDGIVLRTSGDDLKP